MPIDGSLDFLDYEKYLGSGIFVKNNIYFAPILHGRMEFGVAVSMLVETVRPDILALELPAQAKPPYLRAVERLPFISVLCVESDGPLHYHLVEPQDGLASAVRTFGPGRSDDIYFIDHFCDDYGENRDDFPDPYAIRSAGYETYCAGYYGAVSPVRLSERAQADLVRERYMSSKLRELSSSGLRVLFVCGLYHYPAVFEMVGHDNTVPFVKNIVKKTYIANLAQDSHREVLSEPAFFIKQFEAALGTSIPERVLPEEEARPENSSSASQAGVIKFPGVVHQPDGGNENAFSACRENPARSEFFNALKNIEDNYPVTGLKGIDRSSIVAKLYRTSAARYKFATGDEIPMSAYPVLFKFLRRYTKLKGLLMPGLFEIIVGARAIADDNFAYETFEELTDYPWIDDSGKLAPAVITLSDLKIDGRTVRFHRRLKSVRKLFAPYVRKRRKEGARGEWLREWDNNRDSICSHQPEDIQIENFGMYLRKKARCVLTDEQSRTEPFMTSLMDGIDMRETIRNFHLEKKLFVKVGRRASGSAGSVVFIFDEDLPDRFAQERYPWKMTWLGEHHQESDMAFYSTRPGEKIVGPGISRCEYGGFMLSFPPLRLYDVWRDPYYFMAKTKPEVLLMAAIEYSQEKFVVYCAKKPPRSFFKSVAAKVGKKIVYLPMGQFSPATINKLQVVHILAGKNTRNVAREYIW